MLLTAAANCSFMSSVFFRTKCKKKKNLRGEQKVDEVTIKMTSDLFALSMYKNTFYRKKGVKM